MNVLLADGHFLSRQGILKILADRADVKQILECATKQALKNKLSKNAIDLLVIDPNSLANFSFRDIEKLKNDFSSIKVLVVAGKYDYVLATELINAGITAFVTKQCSEDEVSKSISYAFNGERFYCNSVLEVILDGNKNSRLLGNCNPSILTQRESEILVLVGEGLTTHQIANKLSLSIHTVNTHRKNISKKLNIKHPVHLIKAAMEIE